MNFIGDGEGIIEGDGLVEGKFLVGTVEGEMETVKEGNLVGVFDEINNGHLLLGEAEVGTIERVLLEVGRVVGAKLRILIGCSLDGWDEYNLFVGRIDGTIVGIVC